MSDFKGQMRTAVLLLPSALCLTLSLYLALCMTTQMPRRKGGLSPRMGRGTAFIMLQVAESTREAQAERPREGQQQVWEKQGQI